MAIFTILTSVFLGFVLIGVLIGVFRSWKKSLVRFGIVVGCFVFSLLLAPMISSFLASKIVSGTTITIFGASLNLSEIVNNLFNNEDFSSLFAENGATDTLINCLARVIFNFIIMIIMFLILWFISMIVYWIVCAVLHKTKEKPEERSSTKTWWGRLIGGVVGAFTITIFLFIFLIPVFGVIGICNHFINESNTTETASAHSSTTYISSQLFYTEDEKIGAVETYLQKYVEIKEEYDSSFFGKFMKYTGFEKLGEYSFSYLTNVTYNSKSYNFEDEIIAVIDAYNYYKENLIDTNPSLTNNEFLDGVLEIYNRLMQSDILQEYVVDILPTATTKWSNGESYFGISFQNYGDFDSILKTALKIFNTDSIGVINNNVTALVNTLKTLNDHEVLELMGENSIDLFSILRTDQTLVSDLFATLTSTNEMRSAIIDIFNEVFEILYEAVTGEEKTFTSPDYVSANIDYDFEGENLQNIVNKIIYIYDYSGSGDTMEMIDNLSVIGEVIDLARSSNLFSSSFKEFFVGFINSDNIAIEESSKISILDYISTKWDDESFEFSETFSVIAETAKIAINISNNLENLDLSDFESLIASLISSDETKSAVESLLDSGIISNYISGDEATVMTDMIKAFIDNTDEESLSSDIEAGKKIIEIISSGSSDGENISSDEAKEIVEALNNSTAIISLIKEATESESSSLISLVTSSISESDKTTIANAITETLDESENAQLISKLFGISN